MRALLATCLFLSACSAASPDAPGSDTLAAPLAAPAETQLTFTADWSQTQSAPIVRGGHVDVTYARARLAACASPTIFAYARFTPGGQLFSSEEAFGFDVPADATSVALWFHAVAPGCDQWDSSYGHNWTFPVVAAPPPCSP